MRIAYCEDERAQAVLTEDMIKSWAKERGQKCIVDVFSSAEQFLFELDGEELVPYDLLLLDISMIGMDGFTLAKQIRKTDMNIRIVFLTSDPSHVFDGYEIEAWRYMMKPVREQKLYEMLDILVTELADREEPYVLLEVAGEYQGGAGADFVCCSGWSLHHSVLQGQTVDSQREFRGSFKSSEQRYKGRGHSSFCEMS